MALLGWYKSSVTPAKGRFLCFNGCFFVVVVVVVFLAPVL